MHGYIAVEGPKTENSEIWSTGDVHTYIRTYIFGTTSFFVIS